MQFFSRNIKYGL